MVDYPVDFGNGYKIQTVYANKLENGCYGDVYDFREDVELVHPGAEIMTGYCVIAEASGLVPDGCNDWNDTIAEAIKDYENMQKDRTLTPYRIEITETYVKEVVIYAPDSQVAEQMAHDLCSEDKILFEDYYDYFTDRSTECKGVATDSHVKWFAASGEVYGIEIDKEAAFLELPSLAEKIKDAEYRNEKEADKQTHSKELIR